MNDKVNEWTTKRITEWMFEGRRGWNVMYNEISK